MMALGGRRSDMRKLFILVFILFVSCVIFAQSQTQKWNNFYKRTEFYDSYGNLQGWAKYNDFYKRMEYFDRNGEMTKYEKLNNYTKEKETKDPYGNKQSSRKHNDFYEREDIKDSYGNVTGYKKWNDICFRGKPLSNNRISTREARERSSFC